MAELPSVDEIMAQAQGGGAPVAPEAGMEGAQALPPEAMAEAAPMAVPGQGDELGDIDALLAQLEGAQMVPEAPPADPMADFQKYAAGLSGGPTEEQGMLLADRIDQLEQKLQQQTSRADEEKAYTETVRVRSSIDDAVNKAMDEISSGNQKLDQAASGFIEGAIIYRIAQQSQQNPNAPVDTDAIRRYAKITAKALNRWASERAKQEGEVARSRKAAAGAQARPQPGSFDIKSEEDFDKFVQTYAKLS
jgi:hypothetical protein